MYAFTVLVFSFLAEVTDCQFLLFTYSLVILVVLVSAQVRVFPICYHC